VRRDALHRASHRTWFCFAARVLRNAHRSATTPSAQHRDDATLRARTIPSIHRDASSDRAPHRVAATRAAHRAARLASRVAASYRETEDATGHAEKKI